MQEMHDQRIFIVDDDPFWSSLLAGILQNIGVKQVSIFEKPSDCLHHLQQNPSMIFLDYEMEEMNGLDFLQQLKIFAPKSPVIFCTSHHDTRLVVSAIKQGAYDYLYKSASNPVIIESLLLDLYYHLNPSSSSTLA